MRVAPHIYRTATGGWRVYLRLNGVLKAFRYKAHIPLDQLERLVETATGEREKLRATRRLDGEARSATFAADAERYLALARVRAMPSYVDRQREIARWVRVFGARARQTVTAGEIEQQLHTWRHDPTRPQSASSLNKYRTALMALYTALDGRGARNPVRDVPIFQEPAPQPRGLPYWLIRALLDAMPRDQSRPVKGVKGSRQRGSLTRARFEVMAWTGMTPAQIKQLTPRHINLRHRWYISPERRKGHRRPRHPRPEVKKPMTRDAYQAFKRFVELEAWGDFSTRSLRHSLERARRTVKKHNPKSQIPKVRPYDFRHSFGTELFRRTGNLPLVAELLDHSSLAMTKRYALGAVTDVMRKGLKQFERAAGRRRRR